ncbi:MAG: hypothetical protein RLZZ215_1160 [Pseudomonadota bacterium]|jgi:hypothetical protein
MRTVLLILLASLSTASFARSEPIRPLPTPPETVSPFCTVYEHANYRGWAMRVSEDQKMKYVGNPSNDQISSIRIDGRCQLIAYTNANFAGQKRVFTRNTPYVGDYWNDKFSSLYCVCARAK